MRKPKRESRPTARVLDRAELAAAIGGIEWTWSSRDDDPPPPPKPPSGPPT